MSREGILGIDHVQLAAPPGCEERARMFFGGLLCLRELEKPAALRSRGGVWFALGGQQLHVGVERSFAPASKAHPALCVAAGALDALAARLQASGAPVSWDATMPERRRFFTRDPWGNRLEFVEAVGH